MHTQETALIKAMDAIMGDQHTADAEAQMDETFQQIDTVRDWILSTNQQCQQPCDFNEVLETIDQLQDKLLGKPNAQPPVTAEIANGQESDLDASIPF
jgi:hypothetical protein